MYGYDNYQKVKAELEARRLAAIAEADRRSARLRIENEDIREIDLELTSTGLRLFRAACSGEDITPIKERNAKLCATRAKILRTLGLPEDYTEPQYTCRDCGDTGFVGEVICHCFREAILKENIRSSGIGKLIETQSFENFELGIYSDPEQKKRMEHNVNAAREFALSLAASSKNLLLIGKTGTGKTHISTAIAKLAIERGCEVIYDSAQNIIAAFEDDKFRSGYNQTESKSDKYLECELLILDDLGTEFNTAFSVSCIYNLLNTRLNRGLSTVISTNLTPEELSTKYDDRIYSRIVGKDTKILLFVGNDKRL
jgi:DNA replication protein DnaC